ncbi:hypothetical protein ACFO0N_08100 [Halobium salinum]|uniref:SCP-2 sterol transfer family protein n=1 Tax=Halobium salinum TaxID=1364940 RepID=A0ABD5PB75_9EURY|nr:hypothetical protein [Halobium salinum]
MTTDSSYRVLAFLAVALAFLVATSGVVTLQVEASANPALPTVPVGVPSVGGLLTGEGATERTPAAPATADAASARASAAAGDTTSATDDVTDDTGDQAALGTNSALVSRADAYVERYNRGVDAAPNRIRAEYADDVRATVVALSAYEAVKRQVADEVIRFEVRTGTGDVAVVTVVTDAEAHVVDYRVGDGPTSPTVVVRTDEASLRGIVAADDRLAATLDAIADGDVVVSGDGVDPTVLKNVVELYRSAP